MTNATKACIFISQESGIFLYKKVKAVVQLMLSNLELFLSVPRVTFSVTLCRAKYLLAYQTNQFVNKVFDYCFNFNHGKLIFEQPWDGEQMCCTELLYFDYFALRMICDPFLQIEKEAYVDLFLKFRMSVVKVTHWTIQDPSGERHAQSHRDYTNI